MNTNRTFGVEMETISKLNHYNLSEKITEAFVEAGINHVCRPQHYTHNRGHNPNVWFIQPDGSIRPNAEFGYAAEIVSPVLKGQEGLEALKVVCKAIAPFCNVNASCGLHVHHGVKFPEDVRKLINAWVDYEQFFLMVVPPSRIGNRFCNTWSSLNRTSNKMHVGHGQNASVIETAVRTWWSRYFSSRYVTLNIEGWLFRNAVEFRLHSASIEFTKIRNWLIATQLFVEKALAGQFDVPPSTFDGMINIMKSATPSLTVRRPVSNTLIHPDAKRQSLPKANTKLGVIANMLLAGPCSKQEIVQALEAKFGPETNNKNGYDVQVAIRIKDFCSLKQGFGWKVETVNGKYNLTADFGGTTETVPQANVTVTGTDLEACDWLVARKAQFAR